MDRTEGRLTSQRPDDIVDCMITRESFRDECRLCNRPLQEPSRFGWSDDVYVATCEICGSYRMTFEAFQSPLQREEGDFWLRAAARQHFEMTGLPLLIELDVMDELADEHSTTSVAQNVSKLLSYFVRRSPRPSTDVRIRFETDYTVIDALEHGELAFYVKHLLDAGLIKETGAFGADQHDRQTYQLTVKGWDHVLGTAATSTEHGRVFVAMWFDESMTSAYQQGIVPALAQTGYEAVCMNEVFNNDDINFAILAEIRRAQFVVPDITGARGGVYFEAGFARALGRDVFFTCLEERFGRDKHFDTEHFQHTLWKDPFDLKKKLSEKILGLKGRGPHYPR